LPGGGVHGEAGRDGFRLGRADGVAVEVAGLVGPILAHEGVDAVGEAGGDGTQRLVVVPAAFDHEAAVEGGEVRIMFTSDVSGEVERPA